MRSAETVLAIIQTETRRDITGEPYALKDARTVRRGPEGKGAAMPPRRLATQLNLQD
jgi:hypothetical protein